MVFVKTKKARKVVFVKTTLFCSPFYEGSASYS